MLISHFQKEKLKRCHYTFHSCGLEKYKVKNVLGKILLIAWRVRILNFQNIREKQNLICREKDKRMKFKT